MNFLTLCTYSSPFQQQSRRESLHPRPRPSSITLANTNNSHYPPPYNYVEYFSEANNFTLICGDTTSMSGCTLPSGQNPWNATIDVIANWGLNLHLSYFGFCSKFCHRVEDWPWIRFSIFGSSRVLIQDNMLGVVREHCEHEQGVNLASSNFSVSATLIKTLDLKITQRRAP